jgi:hypothetical protein
VLQGRRHAFKHVAVHLTLGIADDEFHVLAQLARHLAHDTFESRQHTLERHHARAHQAFLQLGVDACLLLQQVVRILVATVEGVLQVEQVGGGFGQRAGQLLQLRMAVHLQRIEVFVAQAFGLGLLAAENATLGFGVEAAQLIAHSLNGGFHLVQRNARVVDLLFDAATEDRGFTRQVDQIVQQVGGDFHHVGGRISDRFGLACGQRHRHHWLYAGVHQAFDAFDELVH